MHLREGSLGLLALMAPYGSVYAETFTASGTTGSGGPSFSQGWNASSPDLGPGVTCVGCGVPLIPDTYYGEDLYVSTSGTVGAGLTGNVQTAPVKLNTSNTGVLTFTQGTPLGSTAGTYYTLNQSSGLAVSLSQASPQFQSTVGANLSISNSVSGQICVVECASFGGSLESYNASLNIVSTSTANNGTVSFLGIPAPDVNGLSIPLVITSPGKLPVTDAGSIEVNPPSSLSGSGSLPAGLSVSSNTTVGQLSIDLGKFAASLTGNKYLAPEANYSYDGFGISYDIASATLNLSETLSQTDSVSLQSVNSTVSLLQREGQSRLTLCVHSWRHRSRLLWSHLFWPIRPTRIRRRRKPDHTLCGR